MRWMGGGCVRACPEVQHFHHQWYVRMYVERGSDLNVRILNP